MRGLGVLRVLVVAGAGSALVLGAGQVPGTVDLSAGPAVAATDAGAAPATETATGAELVCPGPELLGVAGAKDAKQQVQIRYAAPPAASLPPAVHPTGVGAITAQGLPAGGTWQTVTTGGSSASQAVSTPQSVLVAARGSLAPGVSAMQYSLTGTGDARGLATSSCGIPTAESWLVAGGAQPGRLTRVVLANSGANAVSADIEVLGAHGVISSPNGRGVVVAAHSRTVVLLNTIAGAETSPVAHVVVHGGTLFASVNDSWLDGVVARGDDTSTSTAPPGKEQVIAGVAIDGVARLRVAVPGDAAAVVQTRVLTAKGPQRIKDDVVSIAAHTTRDIDLSALPPGAYAVQVSADVPVVAAAMVERRAGTGTPAASLALDRRPSDLAWSPAVRRLGDLAGAPLPTGAAGLTNTLMLTSVGDASTVSVDLVGASGSGGAVQTVSVNVAADSTASVDLLKASAVWVRPGSGDVHGAILTTAKAKDGGTLIAAMPLGGASLTVSPVPVRQVGP